ncbi:MAG: serpin family protein [Thermoguttaceae bacterium]
MPGQTCRVPCHFVIDRVIFRADHPFVFAIVDRREDSILFHGQATDPTSTRPEVNRMNAGAEFWINLQAGA